MQFSLTVIILFVISIVASPVRRSCPRPKVTAFSKRGLAYNNAQFATLFNKSKVNWAYNWDQTPNGLRTGFDYVPMMWGSGSASTWTSNAQTAINSGSRYLLGFNEPDSSEQADLDPSTAATLWTQYMEPFSCKALLGAPAVTNGGPPMGLTWLQNFLSACKGCTIDFVPIHWYDTATNIDYFKSYVQQAYDAGGQRPIWITEFGFVNSDADQINSFFEEILPWLESLSWVHRYSHFMADNNNGMLPLIASNGMSLSSVGIVYNSV